VITSNVIHRVFMISYREATATGFTIEVDGREYLVTAKHVAEAISRNDTIGLFSNGDWIPLHVELVGHAPGEADISVLAPERLLTPPDLPMEATTKGLTYGQDAYFLGFPYGLRGNIITSDEGYPLPHVKKAIVSLLDIRKMYLDGHNNPGFSGGPVVFNNPRNQAFKVAGVISGYRAVELPILKDGDESELSYEYNTGIIEAYGIVWATELIQGNPIGPPVG
jgi:S1-C subfamily serine protease